MRLFTNLARPMRLQGSVSDSDTELTLASTEGYVVPSIVSIGRDSSDLELMLITAKTGTTLTVERGYDGTLPVSHSLGDLVEHVSSAADFRETLAQLSEDERDALDNVQDGTVVFTQGSGGRGHIQVAVDDEWEHLVPPGSIFPYAGATAPTGWLLCDGAAYDQESYPDLFDAIGATYGDDGEGTFRVPSLLGRFPLGLADSGVGDALGETGGQLDHVHTQPSHTHTGPSHTHSNPGTSTTGNHQHSQGNTGSEGFHTHSGLGDGWVETSEGTGSSPLAQSGGTSISWIHRHSLSGSVSLTGAHAHSNPNTNSNGNHSHSQGGTGAGGTGATGASGDEQTGGANPPYLALNYIIRV